MQMLGRVFCNTSNRRRATNGMTFRARRLVRRKKPEAFDTVGFVAVFSEKRVTSESHVFS